jgi:hypothetical protein
MRKLSSATLLYIGSGLVATGLIGYVVYQQAIAPSLYDGFAQCLSEKGATFYGAWWCPHCSAQKKQFGKAMRNVKYVECSDASKNMTQECKDAGVEGYPTWIFADGSKLQGELSFKTLAEKTACALPSSEVTP